jgi:virginiamycin B lyase
MISRPLSLAATSLLFALLPAGAFGQGAGGLPDGPGKDLVQGICTSCHQPREIQRSMGYTKAGWKELIGTMIDLSKTPDQEEAITAYLATHFPPGKNPRPARQVPGEHEIAFRQWKMPSLGQRSRDPVQGPDGRIWYVGQWGNVLGVIDPTTSEIREWQLPAKSRPHTVVLDRDGTPWWTGNANGTIGKTDPATGRHTVYNMPEGVRDPHTAEFDRDGILWFSAQQSNYVGRLDPRTGQTQAWQLQTKGAKPYGVKIAANGDVWIACNGAACLVRIDPRTNAITEIKLPTPGTTVRRLDIDLKDGKVWYVNSGKGKLGVHDPRTGQIKEWDSPSGPTSHPYAIVVIDGIVWYNESNVRPDMLVRFDPKTEKFQSWPVPSGTINAGIIRHMRATKEGNITIHQSSTNNISLVTPRPPLVR